MSHGDFLVLAYGLTAVLMAVEPVLVWRRHRAARRALGRAGLAALASPKEPS